jgi:predicted permease
MISAIFRNFSYAVRVLSRAPAFSLTAILTLALGIGANSAVFSALDAVVLSPLPFPNGERLVRIMQVIDGRPAFVAPVRIEDWNRLTSSFDGITGFLAEELSDTTGEFPEMARRARVAPRFFDVWGIAPAIGRGFVDADHQAPTSAVISDRYWRTRLAADPNVLEKEVLIGGQSWRIVGVMPPSFLFPDRGTDLWMPMAASLAQGRDLTWYPGVARLKPGVTIAAARADLLRVQSALGETYPDTDARIGIEIEPFKNGVVARAGGSLWLLFAAGSLLLLIVCTNVATLLLTRGAERRREISVRLALGASSSTVVWQLLTETAVLATAGGAAGLFLATAISRGLRAIAGNVPRLDEIALDGRVVLYTLGSVALVTLLCGLLPSLRNARLGLAANIGSGHGARVSGRHSLHWSLAGVQVALSVALLVGAGLLLRSFQELGRLDAGFERASILTFRLSSGFADSYPTSAFPARVAAALEELSALPGVEAAATASFLPGVPTSYEVEYEVPSAAAAPETRVLAEERVASPGYFATLGIPLTDGALCRDGAGQVMVNQRFVEQYFGGAAAVGAQVVRAQPFPVNATIAGVVGSARERGLDREPAPTVYFCRNWGNPNSSFLVRARGDPSAIIQQVRLKLRELEPLRAPYNIAPLDEQIGNAFAQSRMRAIVLAAFAGTALLLAALGLFGTLSYMLSLCRREVGLRMAVGARGGDIAAQFVGKTLRVVGVACAAGLALSFAFARLLRGMLIEVSPTDPRTLVAVVALVVAVGVLAALVPAARAARIEPMRVLREE